MATRACPDCHNALTEQKVTGGIVHTCPVCEGLSITLPFLQKQGIAPDYLNRLWGLANQAEFTGRACPHCRKPMKYVTLPLKEQQLMLDVCTRCSIIWFDRQEYDILSAYKVVNEPTKKISYELKVALLTDQVKESSGGYREDSFEMYFDEIVEVKEKILSRLLDKSQETAEALPQHLPVITYILAGLLIMVFWDSLRHQTAIIQSWGFIPSLATRCYGLTILTSFFLHTDLFYLLDNVFFLIIFGKNIEDYLGRLGFIIAILCPQIGGLIIMSLFFVTSELPFVGPNAGLAGILAYYTILFPQAKIGLLLPGKASISSGSFPFHLPAYGAFILWIIFQIFISAVHVHGYSQAAAAAHLGGAGLGLVAGLIIKFNGDKH